MEDDRPTRPPPPPARIDLSRVELRRAGKPLPIAREERDNEDALARALATMEGRFLARIEALQDELSDRPSRLHVEVAPPPAVERKHWSVTVGTVLAGVLAGAAALVGAIAGLCGQLRHESPDYEKRLTACESFERVARDRFAVQRTYDADLRDKVRGAFDLSGVRFQAAPEDLDAPPLVLLPPPVADPHHVSKTPHVQPSEPLPAVPPPLPPRAVK